MLSERDQRILDFERSWWLLPGPKDRAVQEHLGISSAQYYRTLRRLAEDPEALVYDPMTIRRLRKVKAKRRHAPADTSVRR